MAFVQRRKGFPPHLTAPCGSDKSSLSRLKHDPPLMKKGDAVGDLSDPRNVAGKQDGMILLLHESRKRSSNSSLTTGSRPLVGYIQDEQPGTVGMGCQMAALRFMPVEYS
jgi:hypothetical protein